MSNKNISNFNTNYRWGEKSSLPSLASNIDVARLREARSMLVDEPLFNTAFTTPPAASKFDSKPQKPSKKFKAFNEDPGEKFNKETQINLQPGIESYIINTIKLNKILSSGLGFDQIDYFTKKSKIQMPAKKETHHNKNPTINTDQEARKCLKQFITIMSMHCGFLGDLERYLKLFGVINLKFGLIYKIIATTESSFDVLIDILESYILPIFKILKNLQTIHQFDLNKPEPKHSMVQTDYYSSSLYLKQALSELGIGTVADIKQFYVNDIIKYHRETFQKVNKLYTEFKLRKKAERKREKIDSDVKNECEVKVEEFIRENDL